MVICLEPGADLHMAQLMPLPLTVSCISKTQIGFTFLILAHLDSAGQRAVKQVCVCVCMTQSLIPERHCEKHESLDSRRFLVPNKAFSAVNNPPVAQNVNLLQRH